MNRAATRAGVVLVASVVFATAAVSCRTPGQDEWLHNKKKAKAEKAAPATTRATVNPAAEATTQPEAGPPDILQRKAESYAQALQQAMEARQQRAANGGTTTTAPTTQGITTAANQTAQVEAPGAPGGPGATTAPVEEAVATTRPVEKSVPPTTPMVQVAPPVEVSISPASGGASAGVSGTGQGESRAQVAPQRPMVARIKPGVEDASAVAATGDPRAQLDGVPGADAHGGRSGAGVEQRVAERVRQSPRDPAAQLDQQLLSFVKNEQVPNLAAMSTLAPEDREVLAALLDGLANYRAVLLADPNATTGRKTRPLLEMADRFVEQSDLTIPVTRLCTAVRGYGAYDVMDGERLPAGRDVKAIVYCEVANFATRPDAQQTWETRLTKQIALLNESDGRRVWQRPPETIIDHCRNRRHDFYCISIVSFPKNLAPGRYVMKVTITDQAANKVAESSLPVAFVAGGQ